MIFNKTKLAGVYLIALDFNKDNRGFFARTFCQKEFKRHGLNFKIIQSSISYNKRRGTLRGMHYQIPPYAEEKLVGCIKGKIFDVVIDLRPRSVTYCQWMSVELSADNIKMLYIPKGFAHGFQTLCNDTIVFYQISAYYYLQSAKGIRWNDPTFKVFWPKISRRIISKNDKRYQDFKINSTLKI